MIYMNFLETNPFANGSGDVLQDDIFLDLLHSQIERTLHCQIFILDWQERVVAEIQGLVTDGSISISADSGIRRTCSLSMITTESTVDITSIKGLVGLNRKMKLNIGLENTVPGYDKYGEVVWFPMGIFVLTNSSISHNISSNTLSVTAKDKMCLLNGEVGGVLSAPVDFANYDEVVIKPDGTEEVVTTPVNLYQIVRNTVIDLGKEKPENVVVLDLQDTVRKSIAMNETYMSATKAICINTETGQSKQITKNSNGSYTGIPTGWTYVEIVDNEQLNIGQEMVNFTVPSKELIKQAGDTITSVLDDIVNILGNYEYYYDINGNFVFREIRNFLNKPNNKYYQVSTGEYVANFSAEPVVYSFKGKDTISAYSNSPDWLNVKNDFIVWGNKPTATGGAVPLLYHVAIDELNFMPDDPFKPWQQALLDYDKQSGRGEKKSDYYKELSAFWDQTCKYDPKTQNAEWTVDPNYFLDFIDTKGDLGKYSVDSIGRRTVVVNDEKVTTIFPTYIPEILVRIQGDNESYSTFKSRVLKEYEDSGRPFVMVLKEGETSSTATSEVAIKKNQLTSAIRAKDAFNVVRELIFKHSTMNEVINITSLPLYHLEANTRIEVEDLQSDIGGYYMIRSMNIPLGVGGQMSISAIRANSRV